MSEQEFSAPQRIELNARASFGAFTSRDGLRVKLVDNIEIEDASTLKLLRLKNGDFELYKRVFLLIDGEMHEITMDVKAVTTD